MAYFINENNEQVDIFEFPPCNRDKVYIHLDTGEYIESNNPYLFQSESGMVLGLNPDFKEFNVYDSNDNLIETLSIHWKEDCTVQSSESIEQFTENSNQNQISFLLLFIIVFLVICVIYYKRRTV